MTNERVGLIVRPKLRPNLRKELLVRNNPHAHMRKCLGHGITCLMGSIGGCCYCKLFRVVSPSRYSGDGYNFNQRSSGIS